MAGNDELGKQFEGLNKRMDTLTVEVVDVKNELRSHGDLLRAMQQTQQEMVKSIIQLNQRMEGLNSRVDGLNTRVDGLNTRVDGLNSRVDRLEAGQERLIVLVARIVDRLADFEAGAKIELTDVESDPKGHILKGTIHRISR